MPRKIILAILIIITLIVIFYLTNLKIQNKNIENNIHCLSKNNHIEIVWKIKNKNNIIITINDIHNNKIKSDIVDSSLKNRYIFSNGKHGEKYNIIVKVNNIEKKFDNILFIDYYNYIKKIKLLNISTEKYKEIKYDKITHIKDCWGEGITNNNYYNANIKLEEDINKYKIYKIKIKVRGNTSAYCNKPSYRIKSSNSISLIKNIKNTDYILLNFVNLKSVVGIFFINHIQKEWYPKYELVNLIINGEYKGLYLMLEAINTGLLFNKIVYSDGIIIENDPYWWNSNIYFKSDIQIYQLGYTFKYPKIKKKNDKRINIVKKYIDLYESSITNNDFIKYIDIDSFTRWLILHDIYGILDGAGSNMFLYCKNFFHDTNKLKMGPSWDFDSACLVKNEWGPIHIMDIMHFNILLKNKIFRENYILHWNEINNNIIEKLTIFLNNILKEYKEDIQESWNLDSLKWDTTPNKVIQDSNDILNYVKDRKDWINLKIKSNSL